MKAKWFILCMFALLVNITANAYDAEIDGIYYNINSYSYRTAEVTFANSGSSNSNYYSGEINIPQWIYFEGAAYEVTKIHDNAFAFCSALTSVTIPNSIEEIGNQAFLNCTALTSVTIPNSVRSMGSNPFSGCSSLRSIVVDRFNYVYDSRDNCNAIIMTENNYLIAGCKNTIIPSSVTSIGSLAFAGCDALSSITIPSSVTSIGDAAFVSCYSLKSIVIPEGVKTIGSQAFDYCYNLTSVKIPSTVTKIGQNAFQSCQKLAMVEFASVESLCKIEFANSDANPLSKAYHLFINGEEVIEVDIPNSVTSIGNYTFSGCSSLLFVKIPTSVTSISNSSFYGCSGLTSVVVESEMPLTISSNTFPSRTNATLYVPYGCKTTYENANYWNEFKEIKEIQPNVIIFADANVKATCVAKWDTNGDGELSKEEAATVTSLQNAFKENSNIFLFNELQYFTGLTEISESEFDRCRNLRSVTIPENVTKIGNSAFYYCSAMISVSIPNSVKSIGGSAFSNCSSLTSVTIPNSVTSIGYRAFDYTGLTAVNIPNSVTNIDHYAFWNCSNLNTVTIPNSVISIGEGVFGSCECLTSIIVDSGNPIYDSRNNCNAIIETATNKLISGCKNSAIPESVTTIGINAFSGCSGLTELIIPKSVIEIESFTFDDCSGLLSITVDSGNPIYDSRNNCNAIIETATNTLIIGCKNSVIPKSVTSIGSDAFRGCSGLTEIVIPESVTSIGSDAFSGTAWLNNQPNGVVYAGKVAYGYNGTKPSGTLTIKEGTLGIASQAFQYCYGLTTVNIPNSVKTIGIRAFSDCNNLSSVNIGNGVNEIGSGAFYETAWDKNLPDGLVYAGSVAYKYKGTMPSGTEITLQEGTLGIADEAFQNCRGLTSITIPNSVVTFGDEAFDNCSFTSINIPEGVKKIGYSVFWGCQNLKSVTIPSSVKVIGKAAFWNCSGLKSLVIPEGVIDIGNGAFQYCSGLTSVIIPKSVKVIDKWAFLYCSNLTSIIIPNSVKFIGDYVFQECTNLNSLKVDFETPISISPFTFSKCNITTLYVPAGSKATYESADYWKEFNSIIEMGDVNGDGETDVVDVVDIARYVVGTPAETFISILADINNNGEVNIADAVCLVNDIAGDQNFAKPNRAPKHNAANETLLLTTDNENYLSLALQNERFYTAFQFDLYFPDGTDVTQMLLNAQRKQKHQLLYNKVENGHWRIAALSTSNRTFLGNDGELLSVVYNGIMNDEVSIRDIHFFTVDGSDYQFDDISLSGTTAIHSLNNGQGTNVGSSTVYDMQGRKIMSGDSSNRQLPKGLYIINGKKVAIK